MYDINIEYKDNELVLTPNGILNEDDGEDATYIFEAEGLFSADLLFEDTGSGFYDIVDTANMKYYELDSYAGSGLQVLKEGKKLHCRLLGDVIFNEEKEQYESVI